MEPLKSPRADLENKKSIFREIGLIISLLIVLLAFGWKSFDKTNIKTENIDFTDIQEEMIPITEQKAKPLPPPPTHTAVVIKIVENDIDVENDIVIDVEANQETEIDYCTGANTFPERDFNIICWFSAVLCTIMNNCIWCSRRKVL